MKELSFERMETLHGGGFAFNAMCGSMAGAIGTIFIPAGIIAGIGCIVVGWDLHVY